MITAPNSRAGLSGIPDNPYHVNEMNYTEFQILIGKYFTKYKIFAVGFASGNWLRKLLINSPLYGIGKLLKRRSRIKKFAISVTSMTKFGVIEKNVADEAIDLFAISELE